MIKSYFNFIKDYKEVPLSLLFCGMIFTIIFYLSGEDMSYAAYPVVVCFFFLFIFSIFKFSKYKSRTDTLNVIIKEKWTDVSKLPETSKYTEDLYTDLVKNLNEHKNKIISEKEEKLRTITEYISMWAHQIKTPIAGLNLIVQDMSDEDSQAIKEKMFEIEQYVNSTLQFMRLDSFNSDLILEKVDVHDIAKQSARYFARQFITKYLSLKIEDFELTVITDEKWLLFAVNQIMSNAIKYTTEGGVRVYIDNTCLVIQDTGRGISKDDLPRLFENGFTGYNGHMDKKATGIGLYLSNRILTKLGASLRIESEVDVGTSVYIDLCEFHKI